VVKINSVTDELVEYAATSVTGENGEVWYNVFHIQFFILHRKSVNYIEIHGVTFQISVSFWLTTNIVMNYL
jgi:hypothetical protein